MTDYYLLSNPNPACPDRGDGLASPCIDGPGVPDRNGYKKKRVNGKRRPAHRFAWETANGRQVREGFEIHHICGNRGCWNPDHLDEITHQDNTRFAKGWTLVDGEWFCKRGHHQTPGNLSPHSGGRVRCRLCYNERARRYRK